MTQGAQPDGSSVARVASARLPRTVIALGAVSFLTDVSSEMIYPILPAFLVGTLGATPAMIGLIEGVAEATSAFLKLASGALADRMPRKKPLILLGYSLASIARPLVALAQAPWHVLSLRFVDRIGKGLRTSPRDALIADSASDGDRGRAFGFHRAMDHAGALVGPLIAFLCIAGLGLGTRSVIALAAIPAALALVVLIAFVRETARPVVPAPVALLRARPSPLVLGVLGAIGLFTLARASDLFLLLAARAAGVAELHLPLLWALLHLVRSSLATPLGGLSDRVGRPRLIVLGWLVHAGVFVGLAFASAPIHAWALFTVYGVHAAATDGAQQALVADLAPRDARGRAFGWLHLVVGLAAFPAAAGFGALWEHHSRATAFLVAAALAAFAALLLAALSRRLERTLLT